MPRSANPEHIAALKRERQRAMAAHHRYIALIDERIAAITLVATRNRITGATACMHHHDRPAIARGLCRNCYDAWRYQHRKANS